MAILKIKDADGKVYEVPVLKGDPGYTPQKGVDYWTEADKAEIVDDVVAEVPLVKVAEQPTFVDSIDEMTDTSKLYVLPDGYIYAHMKTTIEGGAAYTNLADPTSADWKNGYRIGSSSISAQNGKTTTNLIEVAVGDVIRVKGVDFVASADRVCVASSNTTVGQLAYVSALPNAQFGYELVDDVHVFTILAIGNSTNKYFRCCFDTPEDASTVIITKNEEIVESEASEGYAWTNTGHAFVPADYESIITEATNDIQSLQNDVTKIEEQIEQGISNTASSNIPDYWQEAIKSASERIKAARDAGGVHCVDFIWTTDIHGTANISEKGERFGYVAKAMMDAADIPMFITTGDIMGKSSYSTAQAARDELNLVKSWLNPIPYQMQALVMGNHDGAWGEEATGYYKRQLPMNEMYNLIYRKQAMDFRRVCDDDGTYYYIDNETQKMRFVFLNSQYQSSSETDTDGNAIYDRFNAPYFGQKQLNWLINTALDIPDGYHVCLFAHDAYCGDWSQIVAIVNAFNATNADQKVVSRTHTDSTYQWRSSTINADFKSKNGAIAAMFAGHVHYDCIRPASGENSMMACPLIQMTTALGVDVEGKTILFGGSQPDRADDTVTEFALDIPVINKKERTITIIRLGAGSDRGGDDAPITY